ncbi:MAG: hypothetical protein HY817_04200 [Candidatus Abawacabacteria bacterium]|nr:hypothetical protein [Candidatus Abawacabacteria bacterium]
MQKRICAITGKEFVISDQEEAFCQEHMIPLPTISHVERLRRTCAMLSSVHLYPSTCALTKKPILPFIPPHKELVVYDIDAWMSDAWDPLSFGLDYDFSRPFFAQMAELLKKAPLPSLECIRSTMENSDYTNGVLNVKNCYLSFGVLNGEDVLFSRTVLTAKDIIDSTYVTDSEICLGCIHVKNCYNLKYSEICDNCSDSAFLFDCKNCKNCYGCSNLVNKEYCFDNQQLTEAEFKTKRAQIDLGSYQTVESEKKKFGEMKSRAAIKFMQGKNNENSHGDFLNNTKDCRNCIFASDTENAEWSIQMINQTRNAFVCDGFGQNGQNLYYSAAVGENAYNIKFCFDCYSNVRDLEYCIFVGFGCMDCFGCIGLKKKQYCILNKQYSKEDYFALLQKIKAHMLSTGEYGQFFPASMSPMDYNRSEGQVFLPLEKAEAERLGYTWKEDLPEDFTATYQIPDNIDDVKDDILNAVLKCEATGKKYKIIKQELAAYRKFHAPIPHVSPIARVEKIQSSLTMAEVLTKQCSQCGTEIMTVYNTEKLRVLCEKCYQREVHG